MSFFENALKIYFSCASFLIGREYSQKLVRCIDDLFLLQINNDVHLVFIHGRDAKRLECGRIQLIQLAVLVYQRNFGVIL